MENNKHTILQNANLCIPDSVHSGCCCRAEHMDIFLHALIFCVVSELKFLPPYFPDCCGPPRCSDLARLLQKDVFIFLFLMDKARVLCLGFCKTDSHSITYFLSVSHLTMIIENSTSVQKDILCIFVLVVECIFGLTVYWTKTQKTAISAFPTGSSQVTPCGHHSVP